MKYLWNILKKPKIILKGSDFKKEKFYDPNILGTLDLYRRPLGEYPLNQAAVRVLQDGLFDITIILEGIYSGVAQYSITSNEKVYGFSSRAMQNIKPFSFHCLQSGENHCIFNEHHVYLMQHEMSNQKSNFSIRAPETVRIERFDYELG